MKIFLVLTIIIWLVSKWSEKARFWILKIIQQPYNYYILIGLLVMGFLSRFDYSDRFGCIIFSEPIFEIKNILFSATSITLILCSFFFKKRSIKLTFVLLELSYWLLKLFLVKGGYIVGICATEDMYISLYDTATLALRFFIIRSLLNVSINPIYSLICTVIVMCVKIYIFPLPYSFYAKERKTQTEGEHKKNYLTKGEWIENKDTTEKIRVVFNPENTIIYNLQNTDSLCFNQVSFRGDLVYLESNTDFWLRIIFEIQENGKDTITVNFSYENEYYKIQMIRKF